MKYVFCTKFYNGFVLKISTWAIMPGFRNSGHIYPKAAWGCKKASTKQSSINVITEFDW